MRGRVVMKLGVTTTILIYKALLITENGYHSLILNQCFNFFGCFDDVVSTHKRLH